MITHYTVTDRRTGAVREYKTRNAASRAADRIDNAYGGYIATVRPVFAEAVA